MLCHLKSEYVRVKQSNKLNLPVSRVENSPESNLELEPVMNRLQFPSATRDLIISYHLSIS